MSNKKLSDEEKAQRQVVKDNEKALKAEARAQKKAAKLANVKPKHQAKLDRAFAQLPPLNDAEQAAFDKLIGGATPAELEKLAAHLNFHVRLQQTRTAVESTLTVGQTVRIKSGNQKYVGSLATVTRSQRIRCYVTVPNSDKEIYLFTSDVEAVTVDEAESLQNDVVDNDSVSAVA